MTLQQKTICLLLLQDAMDKSLSSVQMPKSFFFLFSCRQFETWRGTIFLVTSVWRPWWVQVTSGFLCMCAVCSPQAVTCGFNPLYEDRLPPLICSLSLHKPTIASLYLSHQLYLGSLSCISGINLPFFYFAATLPFLPYPIHLCWTLRQHIFETLSHWSNSLTTGFSSNILPSWGVMPKKIYLHLFVVCLWIKLYPKRWEKTYVVQRGWKFQMHTLFTLKVYFCASM